MTGLRLLASKLVLGIGVRVSVVLLLVIVENTWREKTVAYAHPFYYPHSLNPS